jgi:hypothetical protein
MSKTENATEATREPPAVPAVGSQVDLVLGAGARRWLWLMELAILAGAWLCVYLALRTLAPPDVAWWQAGALGGTAMILVRTWWNTFEAPNSELNGRPTRRQQTTEP